MSRESRDKLAKEPRLSLDEIEAVRQGKTYFNDSNLKHLQRVTRLWWDAVAYASENHSPGSKSFETALNGIFLKAVEAEFVVWQSWPAEWASYMVWRTLGGGTSKSEWDEVVWDKGCASGYDIGPLPLPKLKP